MSFRPESTKERVLIMIMWFYGTVVAVLPYFSAKSQFMYACLLGLKFSFGYKFFFESNLCYSEQ